MQRWSFHVLLGLTVILSVCAGIGAVSASPASVSGLRCEYLCSSAGCGGASASPGVDRQRCRAWMDTVGLSPAGGIQRQPSCGGQGRLLGYWKDFIPSNHKYPLCRQTPGFGRSLLLAGAGLGQPRPAFGAQSRGFLADGSAEGIRLESPVDLSPDAAHCAGGRPHPASLSLPA